VRKFIKRGSLFPLFILVITASVFTLNGCKKSDTKETTTIEEPPSKEVIRFFTLPANAPDQVKAIADNIKSDDKKHYFLEDFIRKVGYPRWDKVKAAFSGGSTERMGNENGDVLYVPFVKGNEDFVNSVLAVKMTTDDTVYSLLRSKKYKSFGFDSSDHSRWNAWDVFNFFAGFDNYVFGHTRFLVKDTALFKASTSPYSMVTLKNNNGANVGGRNTTTARIATYTEECRQYQICEYFEYWGVARLASTTASYCVLVDICTTVYYGSGGSGSGGGSGTGGGTATGTGSYWQFNDCPEGGGLNRMLPEDEDPQGECTTGWVPVSYNQANVNTLVNLLQQNLAFLANPCDYLDQWFALREFYRSAAG
jgi:hypothetical protein